MIQGKDPKNFVDEEFFLAIAQDMRLPGFAQAYMLARNALLQGAKMLSSENMEEGDSNTETDGMTSTIRELRGITDESTWLRIVSCAMGSLIKAEESGRRPVPYGWRWAEDMVRLAEDAGKIQEEKKKKEEREDEIQRRERIETGGLEGMLKNLEEARLNIENEARYAARMDFGEEVCAGSHGIVIVTNGEIRTQVYTEPLLRETACELESVVKKLLAETGSADYISVTELLSGRARDQIARVVEDNAAFHGYDQSKTGSIGTQIFFTQYFKEMVQIATERVSGSTRL